MPAASLVNPIGDSGWEIQGVPSARAYINYGITWDAADGYVLLFGGSNETGTYNADTWTYKSGIWTQLTPSVTPLGRDSSGLSFDYSLYAVVLFGGYTPGTANALNDTWQFRAGAWTPVLGNGPSPRHGFGFAWDPVLYGVLLFGGYSPLCAPISTGLCSDTWLFSFGSWSKLNPAHSPPGRYQLSMTFDPLDNYMLLFGGYGSTNCPPTTGGDCGDTWTFAAGTWTQVATGGSPCGNNATGKCAPSAAPGERAEAALAWDPSDNYAVLFGGYNLTVDPQADTWKYVGGTWSKLTPSGPLPLGRYGAGLTFDYSPGDANLLLFGGGPQYYVPVDVYWGFLAGNWTEAAPPATGPPNSYGGSMTFDAADGYVLYFGGAGSTILAQTWKYQAGVWTQLNEPISGSPAPRLFASMTYDPQFGAVILFGGNSYSRLNDTWAFAGGRWFEICSGGGPLCNSVYPPSPREGAGLAFLPTNNYLVLFGGYGGKSGTTYLNDTWIFYSGFWENWTFFFAKAPSPRAFLGLTYDVVDSELVLFGGGNSSAVYQDTWTMSQFFAGWSQVGSCGGPGQLACAGSTPSRRASGIQVYDGADGGVLVAEGTSGVFGGGLQASTNLFRGGIWYACNGWPCSGWYGVAPLTLWSAAAYDPVDGYTVLRGGIMGYGLTTHFFKDTFVFGAYLSSPGPGVGPGFIDLGQSATFAAGASGGGNGAYRYEWNGVPPGCSPESPDVASFSCPVNIPGFTFYYNFVVGYGSYYDPSVVVTDTNGFPSITSPQFYTLYVARDPKVVGSATQTVVDVGQTVNFTESAWDGWGPYTLGWAGLQAGCAVTSNTGYVEQVSCKITVASLGQFSMTALATDAVGYSAQGAPLTVTVYPDPTATGLSVNVATLDVGQSLSVGVTPAGGSGGYTFAWSGVPAACNANAAVLSCTVPASETGSYVPSVTITDSKGVSVTKTYTGSVVVSPVPTAVALAVDRGPSPTGNSDAGQPVTFNLTSTAGSGGDTFVWVGLPAGCSGSTNSASVACTPTTAGTYTVHATLTDSNGVAATSAAVTLVVSPALGGVTLSASSVRPTVGTALTISGIVSGGSGGDSYAWSGLPAGCVASNGPVVSCAPSDVVAASVTLTVTDSNGAGVSSSPLVITPVAVPAAPFATPFQELELGLLAGVLALLIVAVVLVARRRPPASTMVMSPVSTAPPSRRAGASAGPPPGAGGGTVSGTAGEKPEYIED